MTCKSADSLTRKYTTLCGVLTLSVRISDRGNGKQVLYAMELSGLRNVWVSSTHPKQTIEVGTSHASLSSPRHSRMLSTDLYYNLIGVSVLLLLLLLPLVATITTTQGRVRLG